MLGIIIFNSSKESAVTVFNNSVEIIKKFRISCELAYTTDLKTFSEKLNDKDRRCDILITDAHDESGINAAEKLRRHNLQATVIFAADTEMLPDLLVYRPSGYIPVISDKKRTEEILRAACREQLAINRYFTVKTRESVLRIRQSDIMYFESSKRIVMLHTRTKVIEFYAKLSEVLDMLPPNEFIRCHQSFIVNLNYIRGMDKTNRCFFTDDGLTIEISKSNYKQVAEAYEQFLGVS